MIAGVVLAGGQARRLGGGDKGLRRLGDRMILEHVIARARCQVARLALNANGDPARFAAFALPVLPDPVAGSVGPLAGLLAGLDWAAGLSPAYDYLASFACDTPFLPPDLVARLSEALATGQAELAFAVSESGDQPVFGLWPVTLREPLRHAVLVEGVRSVRVWAARLRCARAAFLGGAVDPFFNINTPTDLVIAEAAQRMMNRGTPHP